MPNMSVDMDLLAIHLKNKMDSEQLSVRSAAGKIGFGAATLSRLLQGTNSDSVPDLKNVNKAAAWGWNDRCRCFDEVFREAFNHRGCGSPSACASRTTFLRRGGLGCHGEGRV